MQTTSGKAATRRSRSWLGAIAALAAGLAATAALAAEPMEIIVPFGPGSGADQLARHCAPAFEAALGAPVQVTDLPGSTGIKGLAKLLAAPADGRTVAVLTADTFATLAYANPRFKAADVVPLGGHGAAAVGVLRRCRRADSPNGRIWRRRRAPIRVRCASPSPASAAPTTSSCSSSPPSTSS